MPPGVKISPEQYKEKLREIQPKLTLVAPYINMKNRVVVADKMGIEYSLFPQDLIEGKVPTLLSAVNPSLGFKIKAKIVHGEKYDYSKVDYKNARTHVTLVCPTHGDFIIVPDCHLNRGHGCPVCGRIKSELTRLSSPSSFWPAGKWKEISLDSETFDSYKFYVIKCWSDEEEFYKVGRTFQKLDTRFQSKKLPYKYHQNIVIEDTCERVCELEDYFKAALKDFIYRPKLEFCGFGECFSNNEILQQLIKNLKREQETV